MNHAKKIQIEDTIYEANTDFRIAIECNRIATDETIGDFERALGVICTMFGPTALDNPNHYEKLLNWAKNYLSCGVDVSAASEEQYMDYVEDKKYIASSFKYDYNYNPYDMEYLSWEDFYNDLSNLSNSELGNCCVLNRVINLRKMDISKIKDAKTRHEVMEAKKSVALKKHKKEKHITKEQEESMNKLNEILGL